MLITELFGSKKAAPDSPDPGPSFDRESWKLGWKACGKDATVDADVQHKRSYSHADKRSFVAGFNARMKDRGLKVYGDAEASDVISGSLHYGELKRDGVL